VLGGLPKMMLIGALVLENLLAGNAPGHFSSNPHSLSKGAKRMKNLRLLLEIAVLLGEIAMVGTQA
jgi:hypothetical protein